MKNNSFAISLTTSLKTLSLKTGLPVNHFRVLVALERAVARIEHHPILSQQLVFKGGFGIFFKFHGSRAIMVGS